MQARLISDGQSIPWTADDDYSAGDVIQLNDGRAAVVSVDIESGKQVALYIAGIFAMVKTTSMALLHGGRAFWDYSANKIYFRAINDRDFYAGTVHGDWTTEAGTECEVNLNNKQANAVDFSRDPGLSVPVGTAAAGAFGRGVGWKGSGCLNLNLTATSEAQKIDWLSKDGFDILAKPIVEFSFSVPTGSAAGGAQDLNIGIASATHATDGDSIANHFFMHFDGNSVKLNFQSKDSGTTVTSTDSTKTLTAGSSNAAGVRKEVWLDCRDDENCKAYVDGVRVLSGSTFKLNASTGTTLFLLAHLEKTSGTETAEVDVDRLVGRLMQA